MKDVEALHTAARRYCIERHKYWRELYGDLQKGREHPRSSGYTAKDLDTFPRYLVMDAIRVEIEGFVPGDFPSCEDALEMLVTAIATADSASTISDEKVTKRAIEEERERAVAYLRKLGPSDLATIEALPYRRTLGQREAKELQTRLRDEWGVTGYWYPLEEIERTDAEAFRDQHFLDEGADGHLRRALEQRGVEKVYALREWEPHWEGGPECVDCIDYGAETFWFDNNLDWIVYVSHEGSIAVGGWLLSELQASWPDWRDHLWTMPF